MARKKGVNNKKKEKKRQKIYLFLEGEENCSEHLYLKKYYKSFETRAIDVDFYFFPSKGGDWKNIKRTVDKEIKRSKHENIEVWCVLDKDQNNLELIKKECSEERYRLVFSNIYFEIWLLYHYYKYDEIGECNKKKYIKKLEKKLGKGYEKSKGINISEEERKIAIQNSKVRHKMCLRDNISLDEAYNCTNFYEIIEKIDEAFKERKFN